jgi:hypothetical protein
MKQPNSTSVFLPYKPNSQPSDGDQYWVEDKHREWKMIVTSEQFMELFNFYAQKEQELFRKGCQALLNITQSHRMSASQNQIDRVCRLLTKALFLDMKEGNSFSFFADLRQELTAILAT